VIRYVARSKAEEAGKDSTGDQLKRINERVAHEPGRFVYGEPHVDYASGSKGNRGPGLADAIKEAERAFAEHGIAEIWVWHTNRLGRGSGRFGEARAIGALLYELRAKGIAARSVEDDEFAKNEMLWGFASRQASKYADDLSANVSRGFRAQAERGIFTGNIVPDGYRRVYEYDENGRKLGSRLVQDPDRWPIIRLMFDLALSGWSDLSIAQEFGRRGYLTNPQKATHRPRPFEANRISQTLLRPHYAGLVTYKDRVLEGVRGQWPAMITPEQQEGLRARRAERAYAERRSRPGRPIEGYVLARVARCGVCGGYMDVCTGKRRRDGTRRRTYVCRDHRGTTSCPARPIDATLIDNAFVANLTGFLGDVEAWRGRLVSSQEAERKRMCGEVERAERGVEEASRVLDQAKARWSAALAAGADDRADAIEAMLPDLRQTLAQATVRLTAARDALGSIETTVDVDPLLEFFKALSDQLSGLVSAASGETKRLNQIVRDFFEKVFLIPEGDGFRILPVLSAEAKDLIAADPSRFPDPLMNEWGDDVTAIVVDRDGMRAWGEPYEPPPLRPIHATDLESLFTSQKTSVLSSPTTTSSSPQRVR